MTKGTGKRLGKKATCKRIYADIVLGGCRAIMKALEVAFESGWEDGYEEGKRPRKITEKEVLPYGLED